MWFGYVLRRDEEYRRIGDAYESVRGPSMKKLKSLVEITFGAERSDCGCSPSSMEETQQNSDPT